MGKGSGSCSTRPALAIAGSGDAAVAATASTTDLRDLLKDQELNLYMGEHWVKNAQEKQATQMLGDEPPTELKIPVNAEAQKKLRLALLKYGPLHASVKELRAQLKGGTAPNPAHAAWLQRREDLLGKLGKVGGQPVWKGGEIDAAEVAMRISLEVAGEMEVFREEREAQEAAMNGDTEKADSYSKWVSHALFSGDAKSGWHTTKEGRVVFLGYAEQIKHLGVAAKNFVGRKDIKVSYRYWGIDSEGRLTAPISSGLAWAPGINQAEGWQPSNEADSAGLYGFLHNEDTICAGDYFDINTGKYGGQRVMISANCMWNVRSAWGEAVKAEYAAPSVFLLLPGDSKAFEAKVRKTAELYHARVAGPAEMYSEALDWAKNELKEF